MRRDELREDVSRYFDGELTDEDTARIEELLASSEEGQAYLARIRQLRSQLRPGSTDPGPDVTRRVLAEIARETARRPARRLRVAAAFVAGIAGGVVFIGLALRQPAPVAAADIPDQVLAAQSHVTSLSALLHIVERGWHPDLPKRTFTGSISYQAPESMWIEIRDDTVYPTGSWVPNDSRAVVDQDRAWSRSVAACPTEALPDCTPTEPRAMVTTGREPFPDASPAPLDLIVPVAGFSRAGEPRLLGFRDIDARRAVGVEVTAAQVAALLDGLTGAGNWREVHPTDRVDLWLDQDALVPLALTVFPADTSDRTLWATRRGYHDSPDVPILEVRWTEVTIGNAEPVDFPALPEDAPIVDSGFVDGQPADLDTLTPGRLPEGMTLHRAGTIGAESGSSVSVASWSDGRAWLKVRWTRDWQATRLFGDLGILVREVPVGSGVAYVSEHGDRIAMHGDDIDLVIMGSLPTETMISLADSLDIAGRPVPADWAEAATSSVDGARSAIDDLLLPDDLEGFGPPAIHVETGVAILAYAGPGNRAFLLTQAVDRDLSPPLEANVRGVTVRGIGGRYSPDRGLLEWVEGDLAFGLTSTTLSLDELVSIAETLSQP